MNNRLLITLAILFAFVPSASPATTTLTADGSWWQGLSDHDKLIAVEAGLQSYSSGYDNGRASAQALVLNDALDARKHGDVARSKVLWSETADLGEKAEHLYYSKTFLTYIGDVNSFYDRYPSRTWFSAVIFCLADGHSCDDMMKDVNRI